MVTFSVCVSCLCLIGNVNSKIVPLEKGYSNFRS